MMEKLLEKIAEQVPNLAMLGFIVYMFLKHLAIRDNDFNSAMKALHEDHIASGAISQQIIKENTDSNRAVVKAVAELTINCAAIGKKDNRHG